ncbi:hypothetical protein [Gluconacetobacter johannae]|uniref:hypothetical protein n=1 Tax=Gluconacetobacter johannae TaxID=112140 RepID=UPI001C7F5641
MRVLSEVGVDGATVSDMARRHDLTRQHLYQLAALAASALPLLAITVRIFSRSSG